MENKRWYVMRYLYNHRGDTPQRLKEAGIESFIPMQTQLQKRNGRVIKQEVPVIRDLLFVYATFEELLPIRQSNTYFQHRFIRGGKPGEPMVIPDPEMEQFIRAVTQSSHPLYFLPDELDITKGTRIRLIGGPSNGSEGIFVKVKGARAKRLVVELTNMMAVAVEVAPDMVEVVEEKGQ